MKATARKTDAPLADRVHDKTISSFVRGIEGECDREAIRLLMGLGALSIDDPAKLVDAVERLEMQNTD